MFITSTGGRRNGFDVGHLQTPDQVEVWPENWPTVRLFDRVCTQWRTGARGVIGLDYAAMYPVMERMQLGAADWLQTLDDIRAMEEAAMLQMQETAGEA